MELAIRLGDPKCIRAAGTANGKNPIAIVIPCHRVIGAGNKLTGYAGGIWRKKKLLELEMNNIPLEQSDRMTLF
jgi:methylated-DNA-[protein]-cysteine S-methyltransferase